MDPFQWRESVLSTRSLSYVSNAGSSSLATPAPNPHPGSAAHRSGSTSYFRLPPSQGRRGTVTSASDYSDDQDEDTMMGETPAEEEPRGGEAGGTAMALDRIVELPDSVAHSRLFELPREIRDRIYTLCLTTRGAASVFGSSGPHHHHSSREDLPVEWPAERRQLHLQPALLRTCRIVHDEAAPVLYGLNTLAFHQPSDANMFARAMAAPQLLRKHVTTIKLHIKSQDTRIWMPYLTSSPLGVRHLRADYPHLRTVTVTFRHGRWPPHHPAEVNLADWPDNGDHRWEELLAGLRGAYGLHGLPTWLEVGDAEFHAYLARHPLAFLDHAGPDLAARQRAMGFYKARAANAARCPDAPAIRVLCSCRVSTAHFLALLAPSAGTRLAAAAAAGGGGAPGGGEGIAGVLARGGLTTPTTTASAEFVPRPCQDGDIFRGFHPRDLLHRAEVLAKLRAWQQQQTMPGGSSTPSTPSPTGSSSNSSGSGGKCFSVRTPYADRAGILIALEIHAVWGGKEGGPLGHGQGQGGWNF